MRHDYDTNKKIEQSSTRENSSRVYWGFTAYVYKKTDPTFYTDSATRVTAHYTDVLYELQYTTCHMTTACDWQQTYRPCILHTWYCCVAKWASSIHWYNRRQQKKKSRSCGTGSSSTIGAHRTAVLMPPALNSSNFTFLFCFGLFFLAKVRQQQQCWHLTPLLSIGRRWQIVCKGPWLDYVAAPTLFTTRYLVSVLPRMGCFALSPSFFSSVSLYLAVPSFVQQVQSSAHE